MTFGPWSQVGRTLPDAKFRLDLFRWDTLLVGIIIAAFVVMLMGSPIINY